MLPSPEPAALPVCWLEADPVAETVAFEVDAAVAVELVLLVELELEVVVAATKALDVPV
jgi:hypothetical protein